MGSKMIALAGVVVSATFAYYCIDFKKNEILNKCQIGEKKTDTSDTATSPASWQTTSENVTKTVKTDVVSKTADTTTETSFQKSDPAFGVIIDKEINVVGMFAPEEKDRALVSYIDEMCMQADCINDIRFSEDIKSVNWGQDMIALIQYFRENRTPDASIYINSNVLRIEGVVSDQDARDRLESILSKLQKNGLHIDNKTVMKDSRPETEKRKQTTATAIAAKTDIQSDTNVQSTEPKSIAKPEKSRKSVVEKTKKIPEVQTDRSQLQALLEREPIQFDTQSRRLLPQSQQTLDQVVKILKTEGAEKVRIKASANVGEDALVNTIVAQKRATVVQNYLRQKGITKSTTTTLSNGDQIIIEIVE